MRAHRIEYIFSVNTHTPPTMTVESGEEFTVEVRGAFDDVEDISAVPTPFTPACDGHPLAPIAGPIVVRGAKPDDVVAIDCCPLSDSDTRRCAEVSSKLTSEPTKRSGLRRRQEHFARHGEHPTAQVGGALRLWRPPVACP